MGKRQIGQTFENRRHKIVLLTRFFGETSGENSVITDYHDHDAKIAASIWAEKNIAPCQ